MVEYKAPHREYEFILKEVLKIEEVLSKYPEYDEASWDMIQMISEQFGKINEEYWVTSNKEGDEVGAIFDEGRVIVPEKMKEATKMVIESGLTQLFGHQKYGGMEFPNVISVLSDEMSCSANMSLGVYMCLTKVPITVLDTMEAKK